MLLVLLGCAPSSDDTHRVCTVWDEDDSGGIGPVLTGPSSFEPVDGPLECLQLGHVVRAGDGAWFLEVVRGVM